MAPEFAYLIPAVAALFGLFILGMVTVIGSITKRCESCGKEFIGDSDLLNHKKVCSHSDTVKISRAA